MQTSNTKDRGFTLIEVLVALTVVAFSVLGLLGLQARNIKTIARDQNMTRATLLGREMLSQIQYEVLLKGLDSLSNQQGTFGREYPGFRWEREVINTGLDEMREVIVRVIFDEAAPRACEIVYFVRDPAI